MSDKFIRGIKEVVAVEAGILIFYMGGKFMFLQRLFGQSLKPAALAADEELGAVPLFIMSEQGSFLVELCRTLETELHMRQVVVNVVDEVIKILSLEVAVIAQVESPSFFILKHLWFYFLHIFNLWNLGLLFLLIFSIFLNITKECIFHQTIEC